MMTLLSSGGGRVKRGSPKPIRRGRAAVRRAVQNPEGRRSNRLAGGSVRFGGGTPGGEYKSYDSSTNSHRDDNRRIRRIGPMASKVRARAVSRCFAGGGITAGPSRHPFEPRGFAEPQKDGDGQDACPTEGLDKKFWVILTCFDLFGPSLFFSFS